MKKSKTTTVRQVDLHLHSYYSDGENSPHEVLRLAKKAKFAMTAIADHNTLEHVGESMEAARQLKIDTVPAAEIGVSVSGHNLHLIGYGFDADNKPLRALFKRLQAKRKKELATIVEKLKIQGFNIEFASLLRARADYPGLIRVIDVLLKNRENKRRILKEVGALDVFSIINFYFARGGGAFVEEKFPPASHVIKIVKKAGGVTALAHPGFHLGFKEDPIIKDLAAWGLDCLEVFTPKHNWQQTLHYELLAKKLRLTMTAGSDYHARIHKKQIPLASPLGFQRVPVAVCEKFLHLLKNKTHYKKTNA